MAFLEFEITGVGGTPLKLPVTVVAGLPLELVGLQQKSVQINIQNPSAEDISITEPVLSVEGPAASKVSVSLRFDIMNIPSGGNFDNYIDVESTEPIFEGETFTISLTWGTP